MLKIKFYFEINHFFPKSPPENNVINIWSSIHLIIICFSSFVGPPPPVYMSAVFIFAMSFFLILDVHV